MNYLRWQFNVSNAVFGMSAPISDVVYDNASLYIGKNTDKARIAGRRSNVAHFRINESYPYITQNGIFSERSESYFSLLNRMHSAALDKSLKGLLFQFDSCSFSMAQAQEVQEIMQLAKQKGKLVTAYLETVPAIVTFSQVLRTESTCIQVLIST